MDLQLQRNAISIYTDAIEQLTFWAQNSAGREHTASTIKFPHTKKIMANICVNVMYEGGSVCFSSVRLSCSETNMSDTDLESNMPRLMCRIQ